jgi:prefoldin subunit 5
MVNVIEFPRRSRRDPSVAALEQTIDVALASYQTLSATLDGVMNELEANLARLANALPARSDKLAGEHARQVSELEGQLAHARRMMDEIRTDIAHLNATPRDDLQSSGNP